MQRLRTHVSTRLLKQRRGPHRPPVRATVVPGCRPVPGAAPAGAAPPGAAQSGARHLDQVVRRVPSPIRQSGAGADAAKGQVRTRYSTHWVIGCRGESLFGLPGAPPVENRYDEFGMRRFAPREAALDYPMGVALWPGALQDQVEVCG